MDLPPTTVDMREHHVSSQPDGGYALRILKHFRELCNCKWETHGLDEADSRIYLMMNEHQDQRAVELDKAIKILESQ